MNILIAMSAIGVLAYGAYTYDQKLVYCGVGVGALWLISVSLFMVKGGSLKCPLCMNPVWASRKCQKHSRVKPALGVSYRLGIATSVAFRGHYRCPYCGERFSAHKSHPTRREQSSGRMKRAR
ncbi:hypothetical protein HW115_13505 [Verrucomicrobiaceae bacterium N1E253]|uniref:C2H2-type domain-containing protein n=1 Tax=Oceaniferula marina TaxID=2748318 RepID=A0A851GGI0_9BACT|nr:hypothetical protein [Oceaniferula marina]NWK56633.1 hypothetical protein [Oceaniferula marina]